MLLVQGDAMEEEEEEEEEETFTNKVLAFVFLRKNNK